MGTETADADKEISSISTVYAALKELDESAQSRVLNYVRQKLNLGKQPVEPESVEPRSREDNLPRNSDMEEQLSLEADAEADAISPVAKKWMRRNGFNASQLSSIFSIGGDEIDLVAKKVPGKSSRARMRSVFLLKGVAAYLAGGAARFTHEQVKEACLHYDAYDVNHFAEHLKDFAADVTGSKESGYGLTARGLSDATELLRDMTASEEPKHAKSAANSGRGG